MNLTQRLIMVCGMRRSGTTLLQAVLCTDPGAHPPQPESQVLTRLVEGYAWAAERYEDFASPFVADRAELRGIFADACTAFLAAASNQLASPRLLVLKHPALITVLAAFRELLPAAAVVVTVRDPRDQVASELEVAQRAGRNPQVGTLTARLRAWFDAPDLGGTVVVRYEDLVGDFASVTARLERELDLELRFDPARPWPETAGLAAVRDYPAWSAKYGSPVEAGGIGRFRRDLDPGQIAQIEEACSGIMGQFGYAPEVGAS